MRIALIINSPYRDAQAMALLAMALCRKGATCFLVPYNLRWGELSALAPDLVILDQLFQSNEQLAKMFIKVGIPFGVLDSEGGVLPSLEALGSVLAQDKAVRYKALFYCSWGPVLADYAVKTGWFHQDQVRVTGTPRSDFFVSDFKAIVFNKESARKEDVFRMWDKTAPCYFSSLFAVYYFGAISTS